MFERDYLMKMLADLIEAILRSATVAENEENPYAAARSLETAIGNSVDMDASVFMSLSPESMASMMAISPMDANGGEYIARSLALAAVYNHAAGDVDLARFRMDQARAVAGAYGYSLGDMDFADDTSVADAVDAMRAYLASQEN